MTKTPLTLKYRPFQLSDVVGQTFATQTLKQSSIQDKFSHSYVLVGNKGSGKTSTARIIANLLTCENPDSGKVCGTCRACTTIHKGAAMDVIELDGASKRSVEDVEKIIESAQFAPTELKNKVFIIDEMHQLSNTAISALLKITEEPPEYVYFIFCTTEFNKIPDTILSRSHKFLFKKIAVSEISNRLKSIAATESIAVTDEALLEIAKISRGSMRDAIGYLEQMAILAAGKEINGKHIQKYLGGTDRQGIYNMIQSMISQEYALLLDQANDMIMCLVDIKSILYDISDAFRSIMVLKVMEADAKFKNPSSKIIDLPESEISKMRTLGEKMTMDQLEKLSKAFTTIGKEMEYSINDRWVLETILIRCATLLKNSA